MHELSGAEARRLALSAQGFGTQPRGTVTAHHLRSTIRTMGVLQLDSVNVFERSHYLPLYSRLGSYDTSLLDDLLLADHTDTTHVEYWAHVASFIPVESWPLWGWAMEDARERHSKPDSWFSQHRDVADRLLARLHAEGPMTFSELEENRSRTRGPWWDWSDVKIALEYLFRRGDVAVAGRKNFQRVYAVAADVIPAEIFNTHIPREEAQRELIRQSVRALGVAALPEIADYFRFVPRDAKPLMRDLLESAELDQVAVRGWVDKSGRPLPAFVLPGTDIPARSPRVSTILTPFDPITWHRERALRMFGFDYRIEIYTPAPKRIYGYYSLPVLMNDSLVGRVDLKADRKSKTLIVKSAHWEAHKPSDAVDRLAQIVRDTARWRGLTSIAVDDWGDAATDLTRVLS